MNDVLADLASILEAVRTFLYNLFLALRLPIKIGLALLILYIAFLGVFNDSPFSPLFVILAGLLALFGWKALFPWLDTRNTPLGKRSFSAEKNWAYGIIILAGVGAVMFGALRSMTAPAKPPNAKSIGDTQTVAFNADATHFVAAQARDRVSIRSTDSELKELYGFVPGYTNSIVALAYSPAGDYLAFVDKEGDRYSLRLWDIWNKRLLWQRSDDGLKDIVALQIDLTNKHILTVSNDGTTLLWEAGTAQVHKLEKAADTGTVHIALNGPGNAFAVARGNKLQMYDRAKAKLLADYQDPKQDIVAIAYGEYKEVYKNGRPKNIPPRLVLYVLNADRQMSVFYADNLKLLEYWTNTHTTLQGKLESAFILPERERWVAVNGVPLLAQPKDRPPHSMDVFELNSNSRLVKSFDRAPSAVRELFSPTLNYLVTLTADNQVQSWTLNDKSTGFTVLPFYSKNDKDVLETKDKLDPMQAYSWNRANFQMAMVTNKANKQISFYDGSLDPKRGVRSNPEIASLDGTGSPITLTAFATDKSFYTVDRSGYVRFWRNDADSADKQVLVSEMFWQGAPITAIAAVSDQVLLVGNHDGMIRRWNAWDGSWQEVSTIAHAVSALAIDTSHKIFAAGYDNGEIQLRQLDNPNALVVAQDQLDSLQHTGQITALAFSTLPESVLLASAGLDTNEKARVRVSTLLPSNGKVETRSLFPVYAGVHPEFLAWDNEELVVAGDAPLFYVWDTDQADTWDHHQVTTFVRQSDPLKALGIHDGAITALAQEDEEATLWSPGRVTEGAEMTASANPADNLFGLSKKWVLDRMASSGGSLYLYGFLFAGVFGLALVFLPPIFRGNAAISVFMSELEGKDRQMAVNYARDVQLGRKQFIQYVDDAGVHIKGDIEDRGVRAAFGGPGLLSVPEGYAAVIERGDSVVRVVGKGTHILGRAEKAILRVHLFPRTLTLDVPELWTRDHFKVEAQISITHEIDRGAADGPDRFRFDDNIIREKIWSPLRQANSDWQEAIRTLTKNFTAELVSRYAVEDLVGGAGSGRRALAQAVQTRVTEMMQNEGVIILNVRVLDVHIPEAVSALLQKKSQADIENRVKLQNAENQTALTLRKNEADAVALERMTKLKEEFREKLIRRFAEPLSRQDGPLADKEVAKQYIETMERIFHQMLRDDFTTMRFIETMEKLIESPGEKHYYFPDMRELLGAGVPPPKDH